MIPFEFNTRDGLTLTAYIPLPNQMGSLDYGKTPVPPIVFPHGSPFQVRNSLTYNPYIPIIAARFVFTSFLST